MKKTLALCLLITFSLSAKQKQFPLVDYLYESRVDGGFDQYKSKSLYNSHKVALTYDDGPHPTRTPKLLDILKKYNVKATFFILTKKVNARTMPLLKRIVQEGHILASHDHDHDNNNNESRNTFYNELKDSVISIENIVKEAGGQQKGVYYRFPYGAYGRGDGYHHFNVMKEVSNQIYNENCINFAFWDIDSSDWGPTMTPKMISQNIISHVVGGDVYKVKIKRTIFGNIKYKLIKERYNHPVGGGVALLHDIHARSVEATEIFLKRARKLNIEIVPLNEVKEYSFQGKDCQL